MQKPIEKTLKGSALLTSLLVALIFIALYFIYLGAYPLQVPDEGRYVEIPREMLARHDFITPYLNGVKYFEKPVLFYWLQAFIMHFFGTQENVLRFLPVLFASLGCAVTHYTANVLFDKKTGLLASILLGSIKE